MVGLTGKDEGEGHDRVQITLEPNEQQLVAAVLALRKPTVLVTIHVSHTYSWALWTVREWEWSCGQGGALALGNFTSTAPAILSANYPGAVFGATTIAEAIFGVFSPSGR